MKYTFYLLLLLFLVMISSCGTFAYKSVTAKTPLFSKRNDFVGQLSFSGAGTEIYAAYAPVKYVGLSLALAGYSKNQDSSSTNIARKCRDYEISLIPFYPYENVRIEMPFGIGITQTTSLTNSFAPFSPYTRSFLQPTVGFHWDYIETAFFIRYSVIDYTKNNPRWGVDSRYEPGIMVRGGSKKIKGMFQLRLDLGTNYSQTTLANLPVADRVLYQPFHISTGVSFCFNFSRKKKEELKK